MKYLLLLCCLCLFSCEQRSMLDSSKDFRCTKDQLDMVKAELEICESSGFFASVCFVQAKISHCDKISSTGK